MTLHIKLLGTLEIYLHEPPILRFRTRKAQALLIYLAVTERSWSRDSLATLFWPETDDTSARKNLRDILPSLRRHVGDYLHIDSAHIGLNPASQIKCDVLHFSAVLERALQDVETTMLREAIALYKGDFLESYSIERISADFELWVLRERGRLHQLALMGLTELRRRQQDAGVYDAALTTNHQLLKLAPWDEEAHRQQMLLLAQGGQRSAALAQYETCRQILGDELGVEPMAETVELYEQIQSRKLEQIPRPNSNVASTDNLPATAQIASVTDPAIPTNLLKPLAEFIGREAELASVRKRLETTDCRLLTIVGPGGMGKSSLAIAVGQQLLQAAEPIFIHGIFWVSLVDVRPTGHEAASQSRADDTNVKQAVLSTIIEQLNAHSGVSLQSIPQLHAYLRPRRLLLILDNFEHLLAGSQALITLLAQAPQVKILVTSRAHLNVRGESLLTLDKLSLPTPVVGVDDMLVQPPAGKPVHGESWRTSEAMAMFAQRVQLLDPNFTVHAETIGPVSRICQLVDGLPLGIELAASMLPLLGCDELAGELAKGFDVLEAELHDLRSDQLTLQAVFERSWQLLSPDGQQLLVRLAIFPGSFDRNAATHIAGASIVLLKRLLDQSLVSKAGAERYILHRTIHAFARQKLAQWPKRTRDCGENRRLLPESSQEMGAALHVEQSMATTLRVQYTRFYLAFLTRLEPAFRGAEYAAAKNQIQAELHNVHSAWRWAFTDQMLDEITHCLNVLFHFYEQHGFFSEAIGLFEYGVSRLQQREEEEDSHSGREVNLLIANLQSLLGFYHARLGQTQQAQAAYENSWSRLKDADAPAAAARCLARWGGSIRDHDPQKSLALLTESMRLAKASNEQIMQRQIYMELGEANVLLGRYDDAEANYLDGAALARQLNQPRGLASGHKALGRIHTIHGRYPQAEAELREAIALMQHYHFNHLCLESMMMLGKAIRLQGRFAEAKSYLRECRRVAEELGGDVLIAPILWEEGRMAEQRGEYITAEALITESLEIGHPNWWAPMLSARGWVLLGLNKVDEAYAWFQKILTSAEARGRTPLSLEAQAGLAYIALCQTDAEKLGAAAYNETITDIASTFRQIQQHPAATQELRDLIGQLRITAN